MAKPLNEFGGWLFFFYFTLIIGLIVYPIVLILMFIGVFATENSKQIIEFIVYTVDISISFYFLIQIIRIVKDKDPSVPERIINYLKLIMIFSLILLVFEIPIILWANDGQWTSDDSRSVRSSLQTIITYLIWRKYFRSSKRVMMYYVSNLSEYIENENNIVDEKEKNGEEIKS